MDYDPEGHLQVPPSMIQLKSSDGEIFQVEVKVAKLSLYIKDMLDDLGVEENEVISIPQNAPEISGNILGKITQWANYHKDDPALAEDDDKDVNSTDDISSLDAEFLQVDQATLFQMIRAADYLNIRGLLDVTCRTAAKMIKEMTPEDVREKFNIRNDFSRDEIERVRKEYRWCDEFDSEKSNDTTVHGRVMDEISTDSVQEVDNQGFQVLLDCLNNSMIVKNMFEHLSDAELLKLSFVNKMWNYEARSVMRKRGNLFARVSCTDYFYGSCQENVEAFLSATRQMNIVPFSAINISISPECTKAKEVLSSSRDRILDQLQLKKFSLSAVLYRGNGNCPAHLLAKKILQEFKEDLEELSLKVKATPEVFIEQFVQEYKFPRLKVLKMLQLYPNPYAEGTSNMKVLVSRAPRLQELHTAARIQSVLNSMEGSSAVIVYTRKVCAPFDEIPEAAVAELRLEKVQLYYTGSRFNFERFNRITPVLLKNSCTTVRSMWIDAVLAVPLMCYGVGLEKVEELDMSIHYRQLVTRVPRILRIIKNFDFTRIFPNVNKVKICWHYIEDLSVHRLDRIIEQAEVLLTDPKPDRAANVVELHIDSRYLLGETAQFFAEMFPSVQKLNVRAAPVTDTLFGSIWERWLHLKELEIVEERTRYVEIISNLDSVFCGIFPEEVAELRLKDEEYLKSVHIVPVMPAITCLKNLRVLSLHRIGYGISWPDVNDGTFLFSKVTECIVFARCPALALNLKFSLKGGGYRATTHLKSFASVTFN